MSNYYQILQVPEAATDSQIRQAYRCLALKWHPDKNPTNQAEANTKFKELSNAYEILSDPVKRRNYDEERAMALQEYSAGAHGFGTAGPGWFPSPYVFQDPEDIFKHFFADFDLFMNFEPGARIVSNSVSTSDNYGGVVSYHSSSVSTSTVIRNGHKMTTKRTVTNGVEVTEVYENDRLVSSTTRNV